MPQNTQKAIQQLKNMLKWSDRLGSDEIAEINTIIYETLSAQKITKPKTT